MQPTKGILNTSEIKSMQPSAKFNSSDVKSMQPTKGILNTSEIKSMQPSKDVLSKLPQKL
jgi:hypothetical protein